MEEKTSKLLSSLLIIFLIGLTSVSCFSEANIEGVARNENINEESNLETYLVFVDKPEGEVFATQQDLDDWYKSILPATIPKADLQRRMVSTDNLFFGFVAKLTADEARAVQKRDEVLSARRERLLTLLATHSPNKSS